MRAQGWHGIRRATRSARIRACTGSRCSLGTGLMGTLLNGWVPSPPGKHTFQNCMRSTVPNTAGKKKTRHPLG